MRGRAGVTAWGLCVCSSAVVAMALPRKGVDIPFDEVLRVKAACNKIVDEQFSLTEHCDEALAAFVRPLVVASCQDAFPTLCQLAGAFGNLTNGAKVQMWNTGPSPFSTVQLYVGDAQQGKSRPCAYSACVIG